MAAAGNDEIEMVPLALLLSTAAAAASSPPSDRWKLAKGSVRARLIPLRPSSTAPGHCLHSPALLLVRLTPCCCAQAFPSFWFGANVTGPDAPHLRENDVLKYKAVWFGWQTMNGVSGCKHEEAKLSAQTAAVKAQGGAGKTTLAYGCDVSNVMTFYDKQQSALADPNNSGWFLHAPKAAAPSAELQQRQPRVSAGTCGFNGNPAWDFRNESARKYFAEVVVGQWADDPAVDSVFVDEADALVCYWSDDPTSPKSAGLPTTCMRGRMGRSRRTSKQRRSSRLRGNGWRSRRSSRLRGNGW